MPQSNRLLTAALVLLVLCAGGALLLLRYGSAFSALRRTPAAIASSTPVEQNGFKLVQVQRAGPDGLCRYEYHSDVTFSGYSSIEGHSLPDGSGLWIEAVNAPKERTHSRNSEVYTVTGRSSTGDTFPMLWEAVPVGVPMMRAGSNNPAQQCILFVTLLPGYPDTWRYVDVTVADRQGHHATWRLNDLPAMRRVLPTSAPGGNTATASGISLHGRVFRDKHYLVWFHIRLQVPANLTSTWEIGTPRPQNEWASSEHALDTFQSASSSWVRIQASPGLATSRNEGLTVSQILPDDKDLITTLKQITNPVYPMHYTKHNHDFSYTFGPWPDPYPATSRMIRFTVPLREGGNRVAPFVLTVPIEDADAAAQQPAEALPGG